MTSRRGREGRLKPQHAGLYPGLEPGVWLPVETLIRHVTDLLHRDPSKSRLITGTRLLHQEHFEYRGTSERPDGLPHRATRLSDSGVDPDLAGEDSSSRDSTNTGGPIQ